MHVGTAAVVAVPSGPDDVPRRVDVASPSRKDSGLVAAGGGTIQTPLSTFWVENH